MEGDNVINKYEHAVEMNRTLGDVEGWTERRVLDLLVRRHSADYGNGPKFVAAEHVRSDGGFDARRTCDFMALHLWPSEGFEVEGFEVKISRGDWLRELKDPTKSEEFMRLVDHWWLVAPLGVAMPSELPPGWGFMLADGGQLRVVHPAPKLGLANTRTVPRALLATFARAAVRTATRPQPTAEQLVLAL